MNNEIIFKSILTNRFSYIPLWKNSLGNNVIFKKYNEVNWGLYNKDNGKSYKLNKINVLNKKQKILFFSAEIIITIVVLIGFIWNSLNIFIPKQFTIFICITIIAYIQMYKFSPRFFYMTMLIAFIASSIYVFYVFNSKILFLTITFYAGLEILLSYTIPTIIEKITMLKKHNVLIFTPTNKKGILLICYYDDIYQEKKHNNKNETQEHNSFSHYYFLLHNKIELEKNIALEKLSITPNNKKITEYQNKLTNIEKELKLEKEKIDIFNQKELNNEF